MYPLKFNIIGKSNGVGLSRDIAILKDTIANAGYDTNVVLIDRKDARRRRSMFAHWRVWFERRRSRRTPPSAAATRDAINLMLEHVWPQYLHTSNLNILIPNPEWFDHRDQSLVASMSHVWSKTRHSKRIFDALGSRVQLIGFDSNDRFLRGVAKERISVVSDTFHSRINWLSPLPILSAADASENS